MKNPFTAFLPFSSMSKRTYSSMQLPIYPWAVGIDKQKEIDKLVQKRVDKFIKLLQIYDNFKGKLEVFWIAVTVLDSFTKILAVFICINKSDEFR